MKTAIQMQAAELGFDGCRIAAADPPTTGKHLRQWLAGGFHGAMGYLERNAAKRLDPQLVLPGVRSIITLAASYDLEAKPPMASSRADQSAPATSAAAPRLLDPATPAAEPAPCFRGVIARYARYTDYHDVLAGPLKALAEFVNRLGGEGTRSLWYVDTGPILERDLGQRAGLGFIGKHTNLIHRRLGNWFFLAEILTTAQLEADAPEKNRCGSCTRCLAACPTQAIVAPFQLDARRCISYLTIEWKGSIPGEFRQAIGNRIFGCDDCLEVCPWNRFAREGRVMTAHARTDLETPDLVALLALDEAGFKARFAGTPILRCKRRGLLRNVCVALGNVGDARSLPALQRAATGPEPLIAEHARWGIAQIEARAQTGNPA